MRKKEIAPDLLAEARRLYEQTVAPVEDIAAMVGLSRSNFYKRAQQGNWRPRRAKAGMFHFIRALSGETASAMAPEARAEPAPCDEAVSPQQRFALALRIQEVVELEMDAMARILVNIKPSDQIQAEQGARTIASVSRALREIKALSQPDEVTPDEADDDTIPRDIDEFRETLARRIEAFVAGSRTANDGKVPDDEDGAARA